LTAPPMTALAALAQEREPRPASTVECPFEQAS